MKRVIGLCLGLAAVHFLSASETDSLRVLLKAAAAGDRPYLWSELGYAFEKSAQPDSALWAYDACIAQGDPFWQGRCMRYQALIHLAAYRYRQARTLLSRAIHHYQEADSHRVDLAKAHASLGEACFAEGDYDPAVQHFLTAARHFEQEGDSVMAGIVYGNIGTLYMETRQPQEALRFHELNLSRLEGSGLTDRIASARYNIGAVYESLDSLQEADHWYATALELTPPGAFPRLRAHSLIGKAGLRFKERDYVRAFQMVQQAARIAPDSFTLVTCLGRLGYYAGFMGKKSEAYDYLTQACTISERLNQRANLLEVLDFWREVAAFLGDHRTAYAKLNQYRMLEDSLGMPALKLRIHELELKYNAAVQEEENQRLRADNAEQALTLDRAEDKLKSRTLFLVATLVVLGIGLVSFWLFQKDVRQKRRLAEQAADLSLQRLEKLAQAQRLLAAEAVLEGQEEERARIARELHDGVGGMLATAKRLLESGEPSDQRKGASLLVTAGQELRRTAHDLMPGALQRFGLRTALADLLMTDPLGPEIQFQWYGSEGSLSNQLKTNVFRIVQELHANILKHANAHEALVQVIVEDNHVHITVEDDGQGLPKRPDGREGLGMSNLQARVAYLKGNLDIESAPGKGTSVYIHLPLFPDDTTTDHR